MAHAHAADAKHASLAYDANTGRILFGSHASDPRYPASLTKIMTLYMAFEMIEAGRLSYGSKIPVSVQAAAQPPSKLGLEVGESIRLIDAMKALVTKSANDIAVAVAERIAGSESRFARLMTKKARQLGMANTTFRNASGLPDSGQVTTAEDMVKLALRIQEDFPQHYQLFKTRYFTYRGKTYKNHNTLLGRFAGVDGIKTGYIRVSGFNLVTSVKKDGKHVVGVVFGGKTARKRNASMRSLLTRALRQASPRKTRQPRPLLVQRPRPVIRPSLPTQKPLVDQRIEVGRANGENSLGPNIAIAKVRRQNVLQPQPSLRQAPRPAARPAAAEDGRGRAPGTLQDQLAELLARSGIADTETTRVAQAPTSPPAAGDGYQIQVGAFASRAEAEQQLSVVARQADRLLRGYPARTQPFSRGSKQLYRARFAGFDAGSATATCTELRRQSIDCFVARP